MAVYLSGLVPLNALVFSYSSCIVGQPETILTVAVCFFTVEVLAKRRFEHLCFEVSEKLTFGEL